MVQEPLTALSCTQSCLQGRARPMVDTCDEEDMGGGAAGKLIGWPAPTISGSLEVHAHLAHTFLVM